MKIRVISINQVLQDISGIGKISNKPYIIKHWLCNINVDGQILNNVEIKTMDKEFNLELKEYEVEANVYNNVTSYMIKKESKWQKRQIKISWKRYMGFVDACWKKARELLPDRPEILFDKIIGCGSVLVDFEQEPKKEEKKENYNPNIEKYDEADLEKIPF